MEDSVGEISQKVERKSQAMFGRRKIQAYQKMEPRRSDGYVTDWGLGGEKRRNENCRQIIEDGQKSSAMRWKSSCGNVPSSTQQNE